MTIKTKKKIFIGLIGLILIAGSVVVASQMGWISMGRSPQEKKPESSSTDLGEMGPVVKLGPLIINLKDEGGRYYLKTTIVLEVGKKEEAEELSKKISPLTDAIISLVSDKNPEELKVPKAKENIKQELLAKLNQHSGPAKIRRIYFDEFLYQ